MAANMRVIMKKVLNMEKGSFNGLMVTYMKATLSSTYSKEMELLSGMIVGRIQVIG